MKFSRCVLSLFFLATPAFFVPGHAALLFEQDFEDNGREPVSSDGFYTNSVNSCCDHSIEIRSSEPSAYQGQHYVTTQVLDGDTGNLGHATRANMTTMPGGSLGGKEILPYDEDRWFGFSVFIDQKSADNVTFTNILNTHTQNWGASECQTTATNSPISIRFTGHNWKWSGPGTEYPLDYYWDLRSSPPGMNGSDPENGRLLTFSAEGDVGRWVNFVLQMRISYKRDGGLLRIWKDGELVYEDTGFDMIGTNVPQSCGNVYPKIGAGAAYIAADSGTGRPWAIRYDSLRWGDENSSFAEVDPARGAGPSPGPDEPTTGQSQGGTITEIVIEAEKSVTEGLMTVYSDSDASGGKYVRTKGTGEGTSTFTVDLESPGVYSVGARVFLWGAYNDLTYTVNGNKEERCNYSSVYQQWYDVSSDSTYKLNSGKSTIVFRGVNDSVLLDYITLNKIGDLLAPPSQFEIIK